ncbi:MAG: hypothetical protein O7G31_15555 [Calditrichaeota bacterium]|nr:hypothetical protein [Calditrichota bacterium]
MSSLNLSQLSREHILRLNEISCEIKNEYHDLIAKIYRDTDKSLDWLVSSTLSRNNYLTSSFLNICYLKLAAEVVDLDAACEMVSVPSRALKQVLDDYFSRRSPAVRVVWTRAKTGLKNRLKERFRALFDWYSGATTFAVMWLARDRGRKAAVPTERPITLIDTFFLPTILEDGVFHDRYYPGLLDCLTPEEQKDIYFNPSVLIYRSVREAYKIAECAREKFIYRNDFLLFRDYIHALMRPLRMKRIDFGEYTMAGFNVGPLLEADFRDNLCNMSCLFGILNYLFFKRLSQEGVKLRFAVNWFENQVIDRGWNKGLKTFFPATQSVGYQGFINSVDYNFYIMPTEAESKQGVVPDEVAVVGPGLVEDARSFDATIEVRTAPAFRFQNVWSSFEPNPPAQQMVVLVALPIDFVESLEIVDLLVEVTKLCTLADVRFHLKPHPSLDMNRVCQERQDKWPATFEVVGGDFKTCLQVASVLVSNSSSVCLETLCFGIPVIIAGSQSGLTQNPIPKSVSAEIWRIAYTETEMLDAIRHFGEFRTLDPSPFRMVGRKMRDEFFQQVTRESVLEFLELPEKRPRPVIEVMPGTQSVPNPQGLQRQG